MNMSGTGDGSLPSDSDEWNFEINVLGPDTLQLRDIMNGIAHLNPQRQALQPQQPVLASTFSASAGSPAVSASHVAAMTSSPQVAMTSSPQVAMLSSPQVAMMTPPQVSMFSPQHVAMMHPMMSSPQAGVMPSSSGPFMFMSPSPNVPKRRRGRPTREETNARLLASLQQQMQQVQQAHVQQTQMHNQPQVQIHNQPQTQMLNQAQVQMLNQAQVQMHNQAQVQMHNQPQAQMHNQPQAQMAQEVQRPITGLQCRSCHQLTADHIISTCGHYYCGPCARAHVNIHKSCPTCQRQCSLDDLRPVRF